ncbi:MAG: 8-amino-7-oxononanoate synthase [Verrucomicrobiales bacterium]|nr:8-amino-7-oxononanoate synthase [Verrucomicrobiales bacterium]
MNAFDRDLAGRLDALRAAGLHRQLRRVDSAPGARLEVGGRKLLNFSSNDYLGLATHPALRAAAMRAIERFGAGSTASRLLGGSLAPHHELEEALAAFKGTEAALTFSSGYATALGTIPALLEREDVVVLDRLAHACLVDAARLSGAKLRVFAHNDLNELEDILRWAASRPPTGSRPARVLIVTESVFSMDGDGAPLRELVELKERYGAWLLVDEAHATGVCGPDGRGRAAELGLTGRIEVHMGTLGKALGASGGFICGSRTLIEYLVNRARSFIFSTAPPPAAAAAALAALQLLQSEEGRARRERLQANIGRLQAAPLPGLRVESAIVPWILGEEARAVAAAEHLRERGIFVPAIRYPTVARGAARLRISLSAAHRGEDLDALVAAVAEWLATQTQPKRA